MTNQVTLVLETEIDQFISADGLVIFTGFTKMEFTEMISP
jgi:hypothetical protein